MNQATEQIQVGGTEPVTALAVVATLTPMQLFATGALNPIVERIEAEVRAWAVKESDISTEAGRKAIRSMNRKIASSKTFIDERRKDLVSEEKKRLSLIDAEGLRAWKRLEALQEEVLKPLTDWDAAEEARVRVHEERITSMTVLGVSSYGTLPSLDRAEKELDRLWDHNFQEFTKRAGAAREKTALYLKGERERITREVAERVEQERLRAEAAEKARVEREAKIAEDARLKAEAEAQRLRDAESWAAAHREKDLLRAAALEKVQHEREKVEAEQRLQKSIADANERERKAEADRVAERERAEAEREKAVQAERQRQENIRTVEEQLRQAKEEERRLRETDQAHRQKVLKDAHAALIAQVSELTSPVARAVIVAVSKGLIPGVTVNY